jgi:hypothetical protein
MSSFDPKGDDLAHRIFVTEAFFGQGIREDNGVAVAQRRFRIPFDEWKLKDFEERRIGTGEFLFHKDLVTMMFILLVSMHQ